MIGSWEPPRIERIASIETRRIAALPVVGLSGDLHQDLGRGALGIEIVGSLVGDEARDDLLKEIRQLFEAGEPVDFVADIVKESTLEQVVIERLDFAEAGVHPETIRYSIVLSEYTEPPEPPAPEVPPEDFGAELDSLLDLDADLGLDLLDLPGIVADIPEIGDLLAPVKSAVDELESTLSNAGSLLSPLNSLFGSD